jgi:hypothetical protein
MPAGATRPRPPAPIKNQPVTGDFFRGFTVQRTKCAEPSLAETKYIANDLLYRKIRQCLVQNLEKITDLAVYYYKQYNDGE